MGTIGLRMIVVTVLSTTFVALFCLVACTTREVPVTPVPPEVVFATVEREVPVIVEVTREVPVDVAVPETVVVEKEVVVTREVGVTVEVEKVVTRTVPETVQIEVTREVPVTVEVEATREVYITREVEVEATREVPVTVQVEVEATREIEVTREVYVPIKELATVEVTREVEATREIEVTRVTEVTRVVQSNLEADFLTNISNETKRVCNRFLKVLSNTPNTDIMDAFRDINWGEIEPPYFENLLIVFASTSLVAAQPPPNSDLDWISALGSSISLLIQYCEFAVRS